MSDIKLPKETDKVIYADDITLITSNENLVEAKNNFEQSLNKIKEWAEKWKLKINPTKSKVMCFTNKKLEQNPIIKIGNEELEYTNIHKILGMIFDAPKLTWKKHVEYVKTKSMNRMNIMKKLTSLSWGANRETLTKFFNIYIKPIIEYGVTIYSGINKNESKKLEQIQNYALRIATGSLRSTPIIALQTLTSQMPITNRIKELECIQLIKNLEKENHLPIKQLSIKCIENFKPNKDKKTLLYKVIETCKKWKVKLKVDTVPNISPIPPWSDIIKDIETNFMENMNKNTPHQMIQQHFHYIENAIYQNYQKIYTDGSKIKEPVSTTAAIYIQNKNITTLWKLPNNTEIIEAEVFT